jgi:hypothetical protein
VRSTTTGLRSRTVVVCSGSGTRQRYAPRLGKRQRHTLGLGSRMAGGGSTTLSRVTKERENLSVLKNC